MPIDLAHLGDARGHVARLAQDWGFGDPAELEVVFSELVTNAIRHTGAAAAIECRLLGSGAFEVAVTDHGDGIPAPVTPYEGDTRGHGMRIVDTLSDTWGVRPEDSGGKTVWARVGPPPPLGRPRGG
ncbi:MAG TPA: ATP-binding protein [Iamia sp.]|nr:ATP-binding protein [Iamia sp.]